MVVAACWWVQQWSSLPAPAAGLAWVAAGVALWLARGRVVRGWATGARRGSLGRRVIGRAVPIRPRTVGCGCLLVAVALVAMGYAVLRGQAALAMRLAPALEGVEQVITGVIDEMPTAASHGWRTRLLIESCESADLSCPVGAVVRLHWPAPAARTGDQRAGTPMASPPFRPGERWRLSIRLKRALAPQNPLLFDAELRALEEGIAGVGSVRTGARAVAQRLDASDGRWRSLVERVRADLRQAMAQALAAASEPVRGVLIALVVGDQSAIPSQSWTLFNRTGVGHLMSISGLHITMLAGLAAWLVRRIWRSPVLLPILYGRGAQSLGALIAMPHAAWAGGVLVAFLYAALAGWGLPAQRTCWMLAVAGLALILGRARRARDVLCTAAAIVCFFDPWAPMAAGFWLSFAAVAAIIWHGARETTRAPTLAADSTVPPDLRAEATAEKAALTRARRLLADAGRTQVAATVALLPLGALFFSSVSLIGPLANAVAIPLVSGVITPLALLGGFLALLPTPLGGWLLTAVAVCTDWLLQGLALCDALSWAALGLPAPGVSALLIAVLACVILLAPWPIPGRAWAWAGLLPLLLAPAAAPRDGELWVSALDVGQGMAVLVETPGGRLLYDTGPSLGDGNDAGARVIGPYLRARGIERLQALVVSHRDTDHSGGALSVMRQIPINWLASSLDASHPVVLAAPRHHACRRGERWQWGEVTFEWLHPGDRAESGPRTSSNGLSCVLRIVSPAGRVLLAGDIEAAQERSLVASSAASLPADLLLAPHHGSATSSSAAFLQAVSPAWAIFQVGYRNRFRHPADRVVRRYEAAGIALLRSDHDGAITVRLRAGAPPVIERYRRDSDRYWRLQGSPQLTDGAQASDGIETSPSH